MAHQVSRKAEEMVAEQRNPPQNSSLSQCLLGAKTGRSGKTRAVFPSRDLGIARAVC